MATVGSIINGGNALVVGIIPGRAGAPGQLVARPIERKTADASAAQSTDTQAAKGPGQLSPEEKRAVAELQERDREVRNEENRHKDAAGKFGGEPQYTYRRGPDGKLYAVEGKVPIHVDVTGTADERKAALRRVQAAAVSVQSPSAGDFTAVAGAATAITAQQDHPGPETTHRRSEAQQAYRSRQAAAAGGASDRGGQRLDILA